MNIQEAKMRIDAFTVEELISFINDNIDIHENPLSQIHRVDDGDAWDTLGDYLGGYDLYRLIVESNRTGSDRWFVFDSDVRTISFFRNKKDILDTFGEDNIVNDYLENNL